ncbi:sodium- and chloride-dependent glycine transporter 1-like isoform X2 [Biomphalaria glabrata]|nr:sodium- and chloride-dependent glycine transporter 1-like isoform X2 [Biomphalaria glabrata]
MIQQTMSKSRGSWGSWFEFLFSALGSMVGLGNIWRFPYVCYRNGGGAFLIPFFVAMVVCGCPLLFLEMLYCQYSNLGPGKVWIICPLFKGIGCGMMVITFVVSVYYTMIMGWTLYYLTMSFSSKLPWVEHSTINSTHSRADVGADLNTSTLSFNVSKSFVSAEETYWFQNVLQVSPGINTLGKISWPLLICLFVSWLLVFLCLFKGIKSMGKVVYVAATLPYVLLTILLIRGCLMPGSGNGLYYYMVPSWDKLLNFEVWRSAATQVFFSIGLGFGLISTLASYNKFHNNCYRDALILPVLDCVTSVYAGFVIFAYLGTMAHNLNVDVDKVVDEGPGLVFIAYPSALSTLPLPQLWSVLFFLMLFCVGLDSQFMHVQGVTTALLDCFPSVFKSRQTRLTLGLCLVSFLLGIPLCTQGGSYILNLLDWYIASFSVMLIVVIEVLVLAWIYGTECLYDDLQAMLGYRPCKVWVYFWKYLTPAFVLTLWTAGIVGFKTIGSVYPGYASWADGIGIFVAVLPILPIPLKMIWTLAKLEGSFQQRLKQSIRPSPSWQPAVELELEEDFMICESGELFKQ